MKWAVFTLSLLSLAQSGCIFSSEGREPSDPLTPVYVDNTSPESALHNLATAYSSRNLDAYSEVLAPEFRFRFMDAGDLPDRCKVDVWDRGFEIEITRALFDADPVKTILVDLRHPPAVPSSEVGMEGTMLIRTSNIDASVTQRDGTTYSTLGDLHEFYFRQGVEAEGEDPVAWFLVEWRDQGRVATAVDPGETPTPVVHRTWSDLKCFFYAP